MCKTLSRWTTLAGAVASMLAACTSTSAVERAEREHYPDDGLAHAPREEPDGGHEGHASPEPRWHDSRRGNVIFIHPDGSALNHWTAARIYWRGPDGFLQWDRLPEMAVYRGHMSDQLAATSEGGATTHAFGVKVQGPDSFGRDRGRPIRALSGFPGSILREAANRGHPVGVVNDGDVNGEPGTGAFLAETATRDEPNEQSLQILGGRPGFDGGTPEDITDGEPDPIVVLGGGEAFFLPEGTPQCTQAPTLDNPRLDCFVHLDPVDDRGPSRTDGRNLLQEAVDDGWIVIRTRCEFDALMQRLRRNRYDAPKVLGLFAADDIFNDEPEETLIQLGLVRAPCCDPLPPEGAKAGRLVAWGARFDDPVRPFSFDPPTAAEMSEMALLILDRRSRFIERKPFAVVLEVESVDNFANENNAIGTLRGLARADRVIGVARAFEQRRGRWHRECPSWQCAGSLILTAADSDASGLQVIGLRTVSGESNSNPVQCAIPGDVETCIVTDTNVNSTDLPGGDQLVEVDGIEGRNTRPFVAGPDALAEYRPFPQPLGTEGVAEERLPFAIAWVGTLDAAGGILSRSQGLNADLLRRRFYKRFDNTDVYRMMYLTLFGTLLPSAVGMPAPDR